MTATPSHLPARGITDGSRSVAVADLASAGRYASAAHAEATLRAYQGDWRLFVAYCDNLGADPLPTNPETVAAFLAHEADRGRKPSTIARRLAAIRKAHLSAGHHSPTTAEPVRVVMRGIRRAKGTRPDQRAPLGLLDLHLIVRSLPDDLRGLRDRALITLGWAGAFRRSDLTDLHIEEIEETDEGLRVLIRKSKTDQEGAGLTKAILRGRTESCPVRCLREWIDAAGITEGRVFRRIRKGGKVVGDSLTPSSVARIIKRSAERAGIDSTHLAGHSLRAGFVTEASRRNGNLMRIMDVTGHRSVETVRDYVREAEMFVNHPAEGML